MERTSASKRELYYERHPFRFLLVVAAFSIVGLCLSLSFSFHTTIACQSVPSRIDEIYNSNNVDDNNNVEVNSKNQGKGATTSVNEIECVAQWANGWVTGERRFPLRNLRYALVDGYGGSYRVILMLARRYDSEVDREEKEREMNSWWWERWALQQSRGAAQLIQDDAEPDYFVITPPALPPTKQITQGEEHPIMGEKESANDNSLRAITQAAQGVEIVPIIVEEWPLVGYSFGAYAMKKHAADTINAAIRQLQQTTNPSTVQMEATLDNRWTAYILGALFIGVFIVGLLVTEREVCYFDKHDNLMAIIRSTACVRREEVYSLAEISLVEIHRNTQDRKTEYKVFFEVDASAGAILPTVMPPKGSGGTERAGTARWVPMCEGGYHDTEEEAQAICRDVRQFLGIPSLQDIMRQKKKT